MLNPEKIDEKWLQKISRQKKQFNVVWLNLAYPKFLT
jgi:hypothetical protein